MEASTWFPEVPAEVADRGATAAGAQRKRERNAYDKALAFVSSLDGISSTT